MKKEDKFWIVIVSIADIFLILSFFGCLTGIWNWYDDTSTVSVAIVLLQFLAYILNAEGSNALARYRYPDGSQILPISKKVKNVVFSAIFLLAIFISSWAYHMQNSERPIPLRVTVLLVMGPGVLMGVMFFVLLFIGLRNLRRMQTEGDMR